MNTKKSKDTISFLPYGVYLLQAKLTSANGCITIVTDTLNNLYLNSNASITGDSKICKNISTTFSIKNIINPAASIDWVYNSSDIGSGLVLNKSFSENGLLQAIMTLKKGKWYCQDSLKKHIEVIIPGKITGLDEVKFCHNDGIIDLKELKFKPANGTWASSSSSFFDHFINTYAGFQHSDDTLEIIYNIIDDMNCEVSKTFNFIVEAIPEFDLSNQSICELSTPILFEHLIKKPFNIASYSYTWGLEFNSQNIKEENGKKLFYSKDLGNGNHNYFGEIQGKNGCKNRDTSIIEITSAIIISIKKEINLCQNSGTIDINNFSGIKPDGGNWSFYDFELITNKQFASTDRCGEFEATYTYDNYGCFDTKKIKINIECKPEITLTNVPNKICDNQLPITLSAQPSNGIWEGANITGNQFNPPIITKSKNHLMSYCVNKGICNFKEAQTIVVNPIPLLDLYLDKTDLCNNQPISISGSVSNANKIKFKYLDNSEESVISDSISYQNQKLFISQFNKTNTNQNIFIIAENEYGCSQAKVLSLNVFDIPKISPVNDTSVCENSGYEIYPVVIYGGLEPLNYMWIENSNIISNVNYLKAKELTIGKHNILITAYNTICWAAETLNIEIKPKPMVDFMIKPSETTTIMQPNFWFQNQSGINQTWLWNFGTSNNDISTEHSPKYSYTDTGNYFVTLTGTNNFGCTNTISKTVIVRPDLLIFIPNAFSPNNKDEEKNNVFSISLDNYATYVLEIYDRWGHKVFYSENPNEVWDGKLGDVSCPPDIYLYFIKINSITNNIYKYKGTITLIK